jgi:hypothetical protein
LAAFTGAAVGVAVFACANVDAVAKATMATIVNIFFILERWNI